MQSNLTVEEATSNLQRVTRLFGKKQEDNHEFEGKITGTEFKIYPILDAFPAEGRLRPEIVGQFYNKNNSVYINLKFRASLSMKGILLLASVLSTAIIFFKILFPNITDSSIWSEWWVVLIFLLIFFLMCKISFETHVFKSINKLSRVFSS